MKVKVEIEQSGKTATGFAVPEDVVTKLGAGKKPAVVVTIKNHSYRTHIASMGGRFMVPLSAENREAAAVKAGDVVNVDITLDAAPREVEVPKYLADALKQAGVRGSFDVLSYSRRKEYVRSIEEAKAEATRERRIAKALEELRG